MDVALNTPAQARPDVMSSLYASQAQAGPVQIGTATRRLLERASIRSGKAAQRAEAGTTAAKQLPVSETRVGTLISEREQVIGHMPLVRRLARQLSNKLPASVEIDDLVQAGAIGLLDASRHYDAGHGASFETYASIRIRGAMVDEIRRGDWVPRSVHRRHRDASEAIRSIEQRTGHAAAATDVASKMALSLSEYHRLIDESNRGRMTSLDSHIDDTGVEPGNAVMTVTPATAFERLAFRKALAEATTTLPEREQFAMSLHYTQGLNLRDVGTVLGVSESRVCQILSQATQRLRELLAGWTSADADL